MKGLFSSDDVRNHAELRREIRLVAAEARGGSCQGFVAHYRGSGLLLLSGRLELIVDILIGLRFFYPTERKGAI